MAMKNGFGKCGETFERGVPDITAVTVTFIKE